MANSLQLSQYARGVTAIPAFLLPSFTSPTCARGFCSSTPALGKTPKKRKHRDQYALAQASQRRAANLARQEIIHKHAQATLGDPVRGITTPFVQSFDTATPLEPGALASDSDRIPEEAATPAQADSIRSEQPLNHFLSESEVNDALTYSHLLTQPVPSLDRAIVDSEKEAEDAAIHASDHQNASTALSRILGLHMSNARDRKHMNIQRCISTYGRHNTDALLPPKPPSENLDPSSHRYSGDKLLQKTPRAGPDTGSSEVQIAILTMKIRGVSKHLEDTRNVGPDKTNKTNLRLLVHKRQKLLNYMRRKERGGPRWENLVTSLGLTRGTYEGEISL